MINHEIFHVIDKAGTMNQYSEKSEFQQIIKAYQKELATQAEFEKHNPTLKHYGYDPQELIDEDYSSGKQKSEVFARLMEHWVHEHEGLNHTRFATQQFDRFVTYFYQQNKEIVDKYFENTFGHMKSITDEKEENGQRCLTADGYDVGINAQHVDFSTNIDNLTDATLKDDFCKVFS